MASASYLRSEARKVSESANDPATSKLAEIVTQLCDLCEVLERKTKEAYDEARRAKREARK